MSDACDNPYLNICGSYYGGLWPRMPVEIQTGEPTAPPTDGESRTGSQQDPWRRFTPLGGGVVAPLPGIPQPPPGDYPIWRAMDADPALTLSRAVITSPIREADHSYEAREGTPNEWVQKIQEAIDPLFSEYMREALDAPSMGWKPFECVYARRDNFTALVDLVPLAQELSAIVTQNGKYVGVRNSCGVDNAKVDLLGPSALVVTCDPKNRDLYGRPWHENARLTWWLKLHVLANLVKLNRKASGIQGTMLFPPASDEAENHTNEKLAQSLLKRYMEGDGIVMPNAVGLLTGELAADFRNIEGLAEAAMWKAQLADHGNNGPQAAALLDQLRYHNTDLSRAWHVPERASQEANTAGSRADSEQHSDISTGASQLLFNDTCDRLSQGPVNTMLVQNYGERARGAVKVTAGKLRDVYAAGDWILIEAVLAVPDLLFAIADQIDLDSIFDRRGIPKTAGVLTLKDAIAQAKVAKQQAAVAAQQKFNLPDVQPNGKANGQLAMSRQQVKRFEELAEGLMLAGRICGNGEDGH